MITSTQNAKVKWVRSLMNNRRFRRESRAFVVEGVRMAEEALQSGWEVMLVFYTQDLGERGQQAVQRYAAKGVHVAEVSPQIMRVISETQTPQGIVVVLSMVELKPRDNLDFILISDGIRDPGNLGTILRTASSAGVDGVILTPTNVDLYAPKVIRSAMGAHFRLPVLSLNWQEINRTIRENNMRVYLAAAEKGVIYYQTNFTCPLAIIIGGEAAGHSQEAQSLVDEWVNIPMPGGGESLNAAIAAALLLYEVIRQRSLA
ncbi:MAG: TrmH family RNA methyltransferase [Anaerolineales bacterium]